MKPRTTISPKLTALQLAVLADACRGKGWLVEVGNGREPYAYQLLAKGLVTITGPALHRFYGDRKFSLVTATPIGRWRALGGKPPAEQP